MATASSGTAGRQEPILLDLPFAGLWRVRNSPARRVPSHGSDLLGERYAIDFVGVDARHRSATRHDWRTVLATEPPEIFVGFGRPILAPSAGRVVAAHDGELDHAARRSPVSLVPYLLGQAARLREGLRAIAGNHVIVELGDAGVLLALVHLRAGSLRVGVGDRVTPGVQLADCGNSGNSTRPHLHLQLMDHEDPFQARGVPVAFREFREHSRPDGTARLRRSAVPSENSVIEAVEQERNQSARS